ncbi:MAG: PP2C family protein-serine/threonine phosphatase [Candidatus Zhuqueibacterota bacterium]
MTQDLKDIYHFYLDQETKERLKTLPRFKRWFVLMSWLFKSLILKLTPVRRLLFVIACIFFVVGRSRFQINETDVNPTYLDELGFVVLLVILMLELKDKLLAQDELAVGRAVQFSLLPNTNPRIPGWDAWMLTRPANEVGGDLVDYLQIDEHRWGLCLGDVAGKGLGAALVMARLQATIRAIAANFTSLYELGAALNRIFCRDGIPSRFVSLVYFEVDTRLSTVRFLNAGHLPPLIQQGETTIETRHVAPALGIQSKSTYEEQQIELNSGDFLVAYSDGLTEAKNERGSFFGETRLQSVLPKLRGQSAEAIGVALVKTIDRFIDEARQNDDMSLIILKRT